MSETLKIRIDVAGRIYPLTINRADEESMRKVGQTINDLVRNIEKKYAVNDKTDALAMCALQLGTQLEFLKSNQKDEQKSIDSVLQTINSSLDSYLEELEE